MTGSPNGNHTLVEIGSALEGKESSPWMRLNDLKEVEPQSSFDNVIKYYIDSKCTGVKLLGSKRGNYSLITPKSINP